MKDLYEENYKVLLKDAKDLKREACHEPRKGKPRIKKKSIPAPTSLQFECTGVYIWKIRCTIMEIFEKQLPETF